jgi:hypothetical protein
MGKMKEVFMDQREYQQDDYEDDIYFYELWKESQRESFEYEGGDEDFIDFVDEVPTLPRRYEEVDDTNEY